MRSISFLIGIVLILLLANSDAGACSCEGRRPPCEAYGAADAVFVGTVIGLSENNSNLLVTAPVGYKFSIEQAYSGVSGTTVEVFSGTGFGDCGFNFQDGARYLVYARRNKGKFTTSICTRTKLFERASEDLAFLGTLTSVAPGVTLYGEIHRSLVQDALLGIDASVTIESDTQRREVRPDAKGNFRVDGLSPGKIKVSLKLPEQFTTPAPERELTVPDRSCANVVWYVSDNGRISGRVVSTDGPVPYMQVTLEDPSDGKPQPIKFETADENGQFLFAAVPAGRYLLSVARRRNPDPNSLANAYAPTFYPGVTDDSQAGVITLGPGEKVSALDIRVTKRPASILEGSVVWSDGTPVRNAFLSVKDVTHGNFGQHGMRADEQGRFKVNGHIGQKLIIEARVYRSETAVVVPYDLIAAAGQVTVTLERATEPLRIVIRKVR